MEFLLFPLTGAVALQGLYYLGFCRMWKRENPVAPANSRPALSIVICARDEAQNLAQHLPAVLEQDYPNFEVLVVDDGSTDDTRKTLEQLTDQYSRLKTLYISPEEKQGIGKKYALRKGVEAATGEVVLLTDADCRPASTLWAGKMVDALGGKAIVLGLSPLRFRGGFLNGLIAYETASTAWQYIASARAGSPYMGVGRNLGFRRSAFLNKTWTETEMQLPSGDDDLFIQTEANATNTATCTDPDACTFSDAPASWAAWYRQKKRHLATGFTYQWQHRLGLGGFLLSKAAVYISGILLLAGTNTIGTAACLLTMYLAGLTLAGACLHRRSGLLPRWFLSPLFDPAYVFSSIFTGLASRLRPQQTWK